MCHTAARTTVGLPCRMDQQKVLEPLFVTAHPQGALSLRTIGHRWVLRSGRLKPWRTYTTPFAEWVPFRSRQRGASSVRMPEAAFQGPVIMPVGRYPAKAASCEEGGVVGLESLMKCSGEGACSHEANSYAYRESAGSDW